jgi:fluoride exporter
VRDQSIDPDVELVDRRPLEWDIVAAVAIGGVVGAEARYGLGVLAPHSVHQFPWTTVAINVAGCLLIGVLMGVLGNLQNPPRLARPLLGTGVLGGFTTFSTFSVDVDTLAHAGRWGLAAGYLVVTAVLCFVAVAVALTAVARLGASR